MLPTINPFASTNQIHLIHIVQSHSCYHREIYTRWVYWSENNSQILLAGSKFSNDVTPMARQQRCTCTHFARVLALKRLVEEDNEKASSRFNDGAVQHLRFPLFSRATHADDWWHASDMLEGADTPASKQSTIRRLTTARPKEEADRLAELSHVNLN